jgi:hypothetical protein
VLPPRPHIAPPAPPPPPPRTPPSHQAEAMEEFGARCRGWRQQVLRACNSARALLAVAVSDLETYRVQEAFDSAMEATLASHTVRQRTCSSQCRVA